MLCKGVLWIVILSKIGVSRLLTGSTKLKQILNLKFLVCVTGSYNTELAGLSAGISSVIKKCTGAQGYILCLSFYNYDSTLTLM